jgi:ribosomal protein S18 acetylase RimI-like enzyme
MDIQPLPEQSPEQIERAFGRFDEQRSHSAVGYLKEEGITRFHCDRMLKAAKQPNPNYPIFVIQHENEILAVVGSSKSNWHEDIYGVPYYKINPLYVFTDQPHQIQEMVTLFRDKLFTAKGAVYTVRVDAQQHGLGYEMTKQGYGFVGCSIRYHLGERKLKEIGDFDTVSNDTLTIRDYDAGDLEKIQDIAKTGHRHSHFFQEPRFGFEQTQNLFSHWLEKCANGAGERIWVAERDGEVLGFSSILLSNALQPYINKRIGVIDFIVVGPNAQGLGVGKSLLQYSLQWFQDRVDDVELRTMADNLQAIRFYESHGFRALSADHHFHLWT